MKISVIKHWGGMLSPASEEAAASLERFKSNEQYEVDIKLTRNPQFHAKVFAFFSFCFEHWVSDKEYMSDKGQRDCFRRNLTVIAGYYDTYHTIKGETRIEAKSLSYASMTPEDFEECYKALIAAAIRTIFQGCGSEVEQRLISFF